ncbi:excisionase [Nocardia puris]|uniref:excisionase n=1 Tax=Nocardia puris TaxID=208602 RepID=UPI0018948689|nr:excisionase [Nocardia puris]MBF6212245.1 excisionase [Nocardia puris]MBF6370149.1 excisionase [Nocardia puris]MBF6460834.1 excisionase [Nocardia puris]
MLSQVTAARALLGLAVASIPAGDAWLFPVVIDITTAIAAALAFATTDDAVRHWFSRVLIVGTAVSVAGNVAHAALRGQMLPTWGAALVVSVAPLAVFADVHGVVLLIRAHLRTPALSPAVPDKAPAESPAAPPVPAPVMPEPLAVESPPDSAPMVAVSVAVAPPPPRPIPVAPPILPAAVPVVRS